MKEQFISMKTTSNPAKFVSGCEEISAYSRKANSFKSLSADEEKEIAINNVVKNYNSIYQYFNDKKKDNHFETISYEIKDKYNNVSYQNPKTKIVEIQRSKGYEYRPSLTIETVKKSAGRNKKVDRFCNSFYSVILPEIERKIIFYTILTGIIDTIDSWRERLNEKNQNYLYNGTVYW